MPLATRVSAQQPPTPSPASPPCSPAPRTQSTISDKVKPQHLCFPKVSLPLLLKHKTSHVLDADLGKREITGRLPQVRSFCILGKTHDQEASARIT